LSGVSPTVATLNETWYTSPQIALSPLRYSFEALYLLEISVYRNDGVITDSALQQYGFGSLYELILCIVMHVVFTLFFLTVTYIILVFKDPKVKEFFKILFRRIWMFMTRCCKKKKESKKSKLSKGKAALLMEEELEDLEFQNEEFPMDVPEFEEFDEPELEQDDNEDDQKPLLLNSQETQ
jgi:hypothetical protein